MTIDAKEKKLFSEWEDKREDFVRDGVVCETAYRESELKIAFILKEPHGGNGGDIRNWLRKADSFTHTWNDIAKWTHGIRTRKSELNWDNFCKTLPEQKNIFQSICAMNLKKSAGVSSTNHRELVAVVKEDVNFIRRQYEIYDPDLTICCGNSDLFKWALNQDDMDEKKTSRDVRWYERADKKYVIDQCHPAHRIKATLKFYPLIDAVNEILDGKK